MEKDRLPTDSLYYEYDKNGNRTLERENETTKTYTYDELNRLKEVFTDFSDITRYDYDIFNNISAVNKISKTGNNLTQYTYDKNNRLIAELSNGNATKYTYDNEGNLTGKSGAQNAIYVTAK